MSTSSRALALTLVTLSYGIALVAGGATAHLLGLTDPLAVALAADAVATLVVFAFSVLFRNSSFYDPYWSVAPMVIVAWWAAHPELPAPPLREALVLGGVTLWGARLTWNWARGWTGLDHEDWRYVQLAKDTGRAYWMVNFLGIHFFPSVLVALGLLAAHEALASPTPVGPLDVLAGSVLFLGAGLEAVADQQLATFRRSSPPAGTVLRTGLWSRSRHPNYLGEILVWVGLWLLAVAADPSAWWTVVGPLAMLGLFGVVSIPMIERRQVQRRPAYAVYQREVPVLLPALIRRQP